jgi:hypothetical protein
MSTHIVPPNDLESLATAPQCVDNQFTPDSLFRRISAGKTTLKRVVDRILEEHGGDPFMGPADKDANLLLRTQRNEYNRSLLYARQVVVNRAAFWNSASLVVSELSNDVDYLAELIRNNVIVPYLYKELSFDEPPSGFKLILGEKAMGRLIGVLGSSEVRCVRLSPEKEKNDIQTSSLSTRFFGEITKLRYHSELEKINQIAQLLLPENISTEAETEFKEKLRVVSREVDQLAETQSVGREHIYQKFIVQPNTEVPHGVYRSEPFTFEIKKWVDAIYTSNLPDALGILTFVPEGFPTAYDLGMTWSFGRKNKQKHTGAELIQEAVDRTRTEGTWRLWDRFQKSATMILPNPDQLSHQDILTIRDFGAWQHMMHTLENFLDPVSLDGKFDYNYSTREMWEAFSQFNRALSAWYLKKSGIKRSQVAGNIVEYAVGIGRILQYGEWMIGLLYGDGGAIIPILPPKNVQPPPLEKGKIRLGIEAGLFFIDKTGIDWRRSQLIQRMDKELELGTDEVRGMISQIIKLFPEAAPYLRPSLSAEMEG